MRSFAKVYIGLAVVGLIVIYFWFKSLSSSDEEEYNSAINAYKSDQYNGVIINKYKDENQHNYQKVILDELGSDKVLLFNIETSGVYDFLEVGDSLMKENGSLCIRVIRNDLDTILEMSFIGSQ
jgi:hypothetical protein